MEASPTQVINFFNGFKQSVIPLFQRPYKWAQKNWQTLWDDVFERYEADSKVEHFLGAIVTSPAKSVPVGVSKFLVIDGQQRLTTLAILLCAIRDSLPAEAKPERNRIGRHYLVNEDYEGWDHFKLLPTQPDRAGFDALVRNGEPVPSRMRDAYEFFVARISEKDSEGNQIDPVRLLETVEHRLMVVSINLGDTDDPYLIFESLNFKGSPLTQADLVRNYFLMRFRVDEQQAIYDTLWLPMQERLGDHITEFMRVHLMQDGEEVSKSEVYSVLKRRLQELESPGIRDELLRMHDMSQLYLRLVEPSRESDIALRKRLERLTKFEVATSYPFLVKAYTRYRLGKISATTLDAFMEIIESYAVRRFFCEVPTNQLKRIYLGLAKAYIDQDPAWLSSQLSSGAHGRRWPEDDEFKAAWRNFAVYYRRDRCRLVLEALETAHKHKEPADCKDATIEHVLPQSMETWWSTHLGDNADITHEQAAHTIGNLTLTAYNPELSNSSFPEKQKLFAGSHISLNAYFAKAQSWRKAEIVERADSLFDLALRLWPRPEGTSA